MVEYYLFLSCSLSLEESVTRGLSDGSADPPEENMSGTTQSRRYLQHTVDVIITLQQASGIIRVCSEKGA